MKIKSFIVNRLFLFVVMLVLNITTVMSQEVKNELRWEETYSKALKKSKRQKKPVLILFTGSDWCSGCKTLKTNLFETDKFAKLANENLVLLKVNIPRNKDLVSKEKLKENYKLVDKYNIKSYPTLMFVNKRGREIKQKGMDIMVSHYYSFIQSVLDKY